MRWDMILLGGSCKPGESEILCDADARLQAESERNKETPWRGGGGQPGSKLRAADHSSGGRISCRQVSLAVFCSIAETEQYFCSLSSIARFTAASSSRPRRR